MRSPNPNSEQYRHQVQSRVQRLLSGRRPRNPELSQLSTLRLIIEAIVEEIKIPWLHKEQKASQTRKQGVAHHGMASPQGQKYGFHGGRPSGSEHSRAGPFSHILGHGREPGNRDQQLRRDGGLVSGASNRSDSDPRFHMARGAGPPGVDIPRSRPPSMPSRSARDQPSSRKGKQIRHKHKRKVPVGSRWTHVGTKEKGQAG